MVDTLLGFYHFTQVPHVNSQLIEVSIDKYGHLDVSPLEVSLNKVALQVGQETTIFILLWVLERVDA